MQTRFTLLALCAVPVVVLSLAAARPEDKKAPPAGGTFKVDPVHSTVIFKCKHVNTSWAFGRFDDVAGSFTLDEAKPENSSVEIAIQTKSVNTNAAKRDDHLRSGDFLDVKQFPTATFKSKSVARKGEHTYAVTGDLMLHGVTKSVTIDMEHIGTNDVPQMGKVAGFFGTLTISRADYGMSFMPGMLGDDVALTLSVEGGAGK